jgi:hypothetical protein
MGFSIEQTLKPSALVGVGGVRPVAVDTSRKNIVQTVGEHPTPQAKKVLQNDRPDTRGLVSKVDFVA